MQLQYQFVCESILKAYEGEQHRASVNSFTFGIKQYLRWGAWHLYSFLCCWGRGSNIFHTTGIAHYYYLEGSRLAGCYGDRQPASITVSRFFFFLPIMGPFLSGDKPLTVGFLK